MMPAGRLRESKHNASRADVVVVTKCPPEISDEELMTIEETLRKLVEKPIFFSGLSYSSPVPFDNTIGTLSNKIILVTGIANPGPLVRYISDNYELITHIAFPDHHFFKPSDLNKILNGVKKHPGCSVLTTEKDMVKLESPAFQSLVKEIPFFYIPIAVQFLKEEREFDEMIFNHVRSFE